MLHYLICDLKNDPALIAEYEHHHAAGRTWPAITASILRAGITDMQLYRAGNRLLMVMVTDETYSPARQEALNNGNAVVAEWETLMDRYQQRLPFAENGAKWVPMTKIFQLGATQ